jgi:hypothetical protein
MGNYNPNYPTVVGNELAPVALDPVTIDTASAFGYTMPTTAGDVRIARVLMTQPPPGQARRKVLTVEVYREPDTAPATGRMKKILVPVTSGATATGAISFTGGAVSYPDALNNPTDVKGVLFTGPLAGARLYFDTSPANVKLHAALLNNRIVDVSVRYAIAGQFQLYNNPMSMSLERASSSTVLLMDDALQGTVSVAGGTVPRRSRLGDYNPFWNTTIDPNTTMQRAPWRALNTGGTFTGLEAMQLAAPGNISVRFDSASGIVPATPAFTLHYCALEITYAFEGREAAGGLDLTNGLTTGDELYYADIPLYSIASGNGFPWSPIAAREVAVMVGQAVVGATSQTFTMPVSVDRLLPSHDTFRGHRAVTMRKTIRAGEQWTGEEGDSLPAVALYSSTSVFDATTIYPGSQVYVAPLVSPIDAFTSLGEAYAVLPDNFPGISFTHIRFYARRAALTETPLLVRRTNNSNVPTGPQASITVEEFDALPEVANGWKEVTLELSAPAVAAGSGVFRWGFTSSTDTDSPWEMLGADANPYREAAGAYSGATYGGSTAAFARVQDTSDLNADYSFMMIQELDVPADFAVSPAVQDLVVVDEYCGVPVEAMPTGIRFFELSWDALNDLAVAGFGYYEIQRRDTTMPTGEWETFAQVTQVTTTTAADYEARVGVETRYRIRQVHEDGYTSDWSAEIPVTLTGPGVTGTGVDVSVLILTSNQNPGSNLAYVMAWDGSGLPEQEFTLLEGGQTDFQTMYGRDYAVAFKPTERAGVQFTRTLLVNAAGVPASGTLDSAVTALRDLAWEQLPYVCVRDERHNRWLTNVSVPSTAARDMPSRGHLVLAPATFREVTATPAPVDYDDPICEGILRTEGGGTQYWSTVPPTALNGNRSVTDTFTRVVANGWGVSDTFETWTATGGAASDFNVNGTVGTILTNTVNVVRQVTQDQSAQGARIRMEVVVPAVATGGTYNVGLIFRWQNATNYYVANLQFLTTGQFRIDLQRVLAGVTTTLTTGSNIASYTAGTRIFLEVMSQGTRMVARAYRSGDPLPSWADTSGQVPSAYDSGIITVGRTGVLQNRQTGNTNATLTCQYDNFIMDNLPEVYDFRVQVRPVSDTWGMTFALEPFGVDQEGGWGVELTNQEVSVFSYGRGFSETAYADPARLYLVKNRLTWLRFVTTPDNGLGDFITEMYRLEDDGVTWTLVALVTDSGSPQPFFPAPADTVLSVSAWQGQVWVEQVQLRTDGGLDVNPNFAAQPPGTTTFPDGQGNTWFADDGSEAICADLA